MGQPHDESTQHLAERLCWQVARRDETRIARRVSRQPVVAGVYRLDDGALLDALCYGLQALGVVDWLGDLQGPAVPRAMVPVVQERLLDRLKTLCGLESRKAFPALRCSDAARMRLVGFKAPPVRPGVCQRGAATRPGPRPPGPLGPDPLAHHLVPWNRRDLEALCNGVIRALATTRSVGATIPGMVDATDRETTAQDAGGGQLTRKRKITDTRGRCACTSCSPC